MHVEDRSYTQHDSYHKTNKNIICILLKYQLYKVYKRTTLFVDTIQSELIEIFLSIWLNIMIYNDQANNMLNY
jgi:hypothetical protein